MFKKIQNLNFYGFDQKSAGKIHEKLTWIFDEF